MGTSLPQERETFEALAGQVVTHARIGITITDAEGRILFVNRAFTEVTGYGQDEVVGRNPRVLQSGRHPPEYYAAMWRAIRDAGAWQGEIWNRRKSGEVYPEWLSIVAVRDETGIVTHYFAMFSDISERKEAEAALAHRALHDPLTDLPNRELFLEQLRHAITVHRRRRERFALLFLDLNGFKQVNDSLGHDAGDLVLRIVGDRIRSTLRASDLVARLGGDEFTVVLPGAHGAAEASQCAAKIRLDVAQPIRLPEGECRVGVAIGSALFPDDGVNETSLLRVADQRMYQDKREGGRMGG